MAEGKAPAKPVGLRLRSNENFGGWPTTPHFVGDLPGVYYPHVSTPLEDSGLSEAEARERMKDAGWPLEVVTHNPDQEA